MRMTVRMMSLDLTELAGMALKMLVDLVFGHHTYSLHH